MVKQSQNRYAFYRDALMKADEGLSQLEMDTMNLRIALERRDPQALEILEEGFTSAANDLMDIKTDMQRALQKEMHLQGQLKRWLMGQSPMPPLQQPQLRRGPPPHPQLTQGQAPGPQRMPQRQDASPSQPQQPLTQQQAIDLRAQHAQELIARAEPMPLGAQPQQQVVYAIPPQQPSLQQQTPSQPLQQLDSRSAPIPTALQYEQAALQQSTNGAAKTS
jgi:hypothetical protein